MSNHFRNELRADSVGALPTKLFLFWRAENAGSTTECVGGHRADGHCWVSVICDGRASELAVVPNPEGAVQWALDREGELLAGGWWKMF